MRVRLSDTLQDRARPSHTGTLDAQFGDYFAVLLDPEHSGEDQEKINENYIKNPPIDNQIKRFIDRRKNVMTAITGPKGIGKSTTIRQFFGVLQQPSFSSFDEKTIIIPFYIDSYNIKQINENLKLAAKSIITSQIRNSSRLIHEKFSLNLDDKSFANFINTHKSQLLEDINQPLDASLEERVLFFRENKPYAYVAELLKYALIRSPVNRVILIVDDLESSSYEEHKEIILGLMRLRECLKSTGKQPRNYKVEFIFSVRPATLKHLNDDIQIDGFNIRNPISFRTPVDFAAILNRRFSNIITRVHSGKKFINNEVPDEIETIEKWESSFSVLSRVINAISENQSDLIASLCNYDFRMAQNELVSCLENSRWFEVQSHDEGAFEILDQNYRTTDAGIIKSLALKELNSFLPSKDGIVSNIFYNYRDEKLDLCIIMILRFFMQNYKNYGIGKSISKSEIRDALFTCYDEYTVVQSIDDILSHMSWAGLLRDEKVFNNSTKKIETKYILMNRGPKLIESLKQTSVFLEIFRDNTFLDMKNIRNFSKSNPTALYSPMDRHLAIADFIDQIITWEWRLKDRSRDLGTLEEYDDRFSKYVISHSCIIGFEKSMKRFFFNRETKRTRIPNSLSSKIKALRSYGRGRGLF